MVQDPGSARPGGHESRGREEDGPGPGGLCAVFPRLLPRHHGGHERSVGGGELVQDPAGLHGRPADQLLHLAASANRKLLLRAPAAQVVTRPRPRLPGSLSPRLWTLSPLSPGWPSSSALPSSGTATSPGKQIGCEGKPRALPAPRLSAACLCPVSAAPGTPLELAPVAVRGDGTHRVPQQPSHPALSSRDLITCSYGCRCSRDTWRRWWGQVHLETGRCLGLLWVWQLCPSTPFSVRAHASPRPVAPHWGCSCGGVALSSPGVDPGQGEEPERRVPVAPWVVLGAGLGAACPPHACSSAAPAAAVWVRSPQNGFLSSSSADSWSTQ